MIKLTTLLLTGVLLASQLQGQVITVQSGMALSKLDWQIGTFEQMAYSNYRSSVPVFIGVDYFNKKYVNLSSNIGYLEKGGEGAGITVSSNGGNPVNLKSEASLQYVSLNTCGELKYPLDKRLTVFANLGPRIDFLTGFNKTFRPINETNELNKISVGINYGVGVKCTINNTIVGISTNVYRNFNSIAKWSTSDNLQANINDRTYILLLSLGYNLD